MDSLEQANYIHEIKGHNPANCIPIALSTNKPKGSVTEYAPSFLLSSVMSLSPKIDEVREVIRYGNYEFVSLVETWLQSHIHDNVINIQGYNLIHRDRVEGTHGGVCVYIKDSIAFTVLDELYNSSFEILWINIRPNRLPRRITNLIVGTVYHLPSADNSDILDYPSNCLSLLESRFPNCGLFILGDFNKLNVSRLRSCYNLKQLVNFHTRGNNTLDIVLTNLSAYYDKPNKCVPFGVSDHVIIEVRPIKRSQVQGTSRFAVRKYLEMIDIPTLLNTAHALM